MSKLKGILNRPLVEKIYISLGLIGLSVGLAAIHVFVFGKLDYIKSYFLAHLAFLPIHALVLGVVIEGLMSMREKINNRKKLSMLLGIFFRQVGMDLFAMMVAMVEDRDGFDDVCMVQPDWDRRRFRKAMAELETARFRIRSDRRQLSELAKVLLEKEEIIVRMTSSPHLLEFENLHKALLRLFHLIEEVHFRSDIPNLPDGVVDHLARDTGRALGAMSVLWLEYLTHLKEHHPVLFRFQTGLHSVINPVLLESDWDEK